MKYVNGLDILPEELLNDLRKYANGVYVYVPKSDIYRDKWGKNTNHHREMEQRNLHIYDKYLEGIDVQELATCYHLSDKSIRRIILSQRRRMEPIVAMIKEMLKMWNLDFSPAQIYHSAWSVGDDYVLKEYNDKSALERNIEIIKILHKGKIPVPAIIPLESGKEYYEENEKMYVLTTKLKGKNIVNIKQCDDKWYFDFGTILASLHMAFKECEKTISFWNNSLLEEMNGWVSRNLIEFKPEYLCQEDIEKSVLQLEKIYRDLPKQMIHRDVHLGNFLFDGREFSGYIDFDLSQCNIRIFDLCYFILGILVAESSNRVDAKSWYGIIRNVIHGYDSILSLSPIEKQSVTVVMKNIELLFVAYFLGIGDEKLAKDAGDLFEFVLENEERILDSVLK
jgi:Putative homoserine kinase type II (protein kinase fold)